MSLILDTATLRGAKQILDGPDSRHDQGQFVSVDITALGSLLEAVCLTDEVLVPDLEHKTLASFVSEFGDAVKVVPLSNSTREAIVTRARSWLAEWPNLEILIQVVGGSPVYRLSGSTYQYLLMQAIGVDGKYDSQVVRWIRQLRSADPSIFSRPRSWGPGPAGRSEGGEGQSYELQEPATKLGGSHTPGHGAYLASVLAEILAEMSLPPMGLGPHPELPTEDRYLSHPSDEWGGGPEIIQFCANLAWTAFRTLCYSLYAVDKQVTYSPHPLRARIAGFAAAGLAEGLTDAKPQESFAHQYTARLEKVYEEAVDIAVSVGATSLIRFPYPSVLPYIVRRAGDREHVIEAAYDLRQSRGARTLRARIADFEQSVQGGDIEAAVRLRNELDRLTRSLRQRLGLEQGDPPRVTFAISAGVASASLAPRRGSASVSKLATRVVQPWLGLLWNIFDALAAADALGNLYETLYDVRRERP